MFLPQANLAIKTDFDAELSSLNREITKNENDLKKPKTLIHVVLEVKVILKNMEHKII